MRMCVVVGRLLVPLQVAKDWIVTLPVPAGFHSRESRGVKRCGQRLEVIEKLVTPSAEGLVHSETIMNGIRRWLSILCGPHPVQVRRRQPQDAIGRKRIPALLEKPQPFVE